MGSKTAVEAREKDGGRTEAETPRQQSAESETPEPSGPKAAETEAAPGEATAGGTTAGEAAAGEKTDREKTDREKTDREKTDREKTDREKTAAKAAEPAKPAPVEPEPEGPELAQPEAPQPAPDVKTAEKARPFSPIAEAPAGAAAEPKAAAPAQVPPEQAAPEKSGWHCGAREKTAGWDCKLVGADPKGEAHAIRTDTRSMRLLDPAFNYQQEQTFDALVDRLPYDPWQICSVDITAPPAFTPRKDLRETSPVDIKSDYSEIFDNEIGNYYGNVEMRRADQQSVSHIANYDVVSETLDLQGGVFYSEDELALFSDTASLRMATDEARIRKALFISPSTPLRGRADTVYRDSKFLSRYRRVAYTSCPPGNQDWVMHASELKINKETGKGAAKNAWLEAKGVPVFYTPYISFPVDDRRLSGFLAPSYHYTQTGGYSASVPYYWNIAPNYDATFYPRYFEKRGILLSANFRYLFEKSVGNIAFEVLPHDNVRQTARFLGIFKNSTRLTDHIIANADLNYVSDKNYFTELGNALSITNLSYTHSSADLGYYRPGASLVGRFDTYQSVDPTITGAFLPYRRLPQVNLNLNHAFQALPVETVLDGEYVFFQHSTLVDGQRLNVKPQISLPLQTSSAFLTPRLSLQHTQYELTDQESGIPNFFSRTLPTTSAAGIPNSISRTLPIASVDGGLFLEREFNVGESKLLHTLEPRLFYLYIPYKDQSNIPVFDSALYDFWFSSMFRENRFSGSDRIQDANQLTAALTSRLVDPETGRERLRMNLGEIFYFRDRQVVIPGYPVETNPYSNIVAELNSELTDFISVETGLQWNPNNHDVERGKVVLHFNNRHNELFNVGYLYRKDPLVPDRLNDIIQSDVSFRWPLYDNWFAVGRWQYSLLFDRTQESFLGLEKENCCWRFRLIGRHYLNGLIQNTAFNNVQQNALLKEGTAQTGVFFQVELKSLTGIGQKLDDFFQQNIYGYIKSGK